MRALWIDVQYQNGKENNDWVMSDRLNLIFLSYYFKHIVILYGPRVFGCLSFCTTRIPPDLTLECVLGDDEGRIWYWPLEIVDIPSPGGTKRHFCFLWSPSSGINAASCNLSLEPSKTLRHLMTLTAGAPLVSLESRRQGGEKGGGAVYCTVYIQLSMWRHILHNHLRPFMTRKPLTAATETTVACAVFICFHCTVALSAGGAAQKATERSLCIQLGGGESNTSRTTAVSFADCSNKPLETPGQMAQLWGMKNNLVPNVMFFNTPFIVGCSADPLGNNVAFCVGSASPPFSLPRAEK